MGKSVTFTMKIEKSVRDELKKFCGKRGFVMKNFVERAILDEIEKEEEKEDLLAIAQYEKYERNRTVPLETAAEEAGFYGKKIKK